MLKQQFIEKTIKQIKNSRFVTALALELPESVYDFFIKALTKALQSALSECWDMAGKEGALEYAKFSYVQDLNRRNEEKKHK